MNTMSESFVDRERGAWVFIILTWKDASAHGLVLAAKYMPRNAKRRSTRITRPKPMIPRLITFNVDLCIDYNYGKEDSDSTLVE